MLRVAIVDDNAADGDVLEGMVREIVDVGELELVRFGCGEDFLAAEERFDLVFIDIYMGDLNGLATVERYRTRDTDCRIVFTTSSREFALEAYELEAEQYLIKPVTPEKVKRILTKQVRRAERMLRFTFERKNVEVAAKDIMFLEIKDRAVQVHTVKAVYSVWNTKLDELAEQLRTDEEGSGFVRCHKSYVVNLEFVTAMDGDFILKNNERIYVTRSREAYFRRLWQSFMLRQTEDKLSW
jgi:DNA-binding LytR/AlgR family response regulator